MQPLLRKLQTTTFFYSFFYCFSPTLYRIFGILQLLILQILFERNTNKKAGLQSCCSAIWGSGIAFHSKQQHWSPRRMHKCAQFARTLFTYQWASCAAMFWNDEFTRFQIAKTKRLRRLLYVRIYPPASRSATRSQQMPPNGIKATRAFALPTANNQLFTSGSP